MATPLNYAEQYARALANAFPYALRFGDLYNTPNNERYRVVDAQTIKIPKISTTAKAYNGVNVVKFVFERTYKVDELKGDRAVLDLKGICTAFNVKDLTKV